MLFGTSGDDTIDRCHESVYSTNMEVVVSEKANLANRAAVKKAARMDDERRLAEGVQPSEIQRENSMGPVGFFEGAEICNLPEAIGR